MPRSFLLVLLGALLLAAVPGAAQEPSVSRIEITPARVDVAIGDSEVAELVRQGRLTQAASYGGFGPAPTDSSSDLLAAMAASVSVRTSRS